MVLPTTGRGQRLLASTEGDGFVVAEEAEQAGLHEYEAVVNSEADAVPENNRYQAFVQVQGAPRVLRLLCVLCACRSGVGIRSRVASVAIRRVPQHCRSKPWQAVLVSAREWGLL